jgi:uracil-DNA glycosylase
MSQQSARSTVFLDEMNVGPQWKLRHPAPSLADANPVTAMDVPPAQATPAVFATPAAIVPMPASEDAYARAATPAPAPEAAPAHAYAPAPASASASASAREVAAAPLEAPPAAAPLAAATAAASEIGDATAAIDAATIDAANASLADSVGDAANASAADLADENSTAWFDEAPAPARPAPVSEEAIVAMDWPALKSAIAGCTRCALCATRRATVQGRGHTGAQWMAITAAPTRLDEKEGRAVAGEAGQLLDNMLKAIGLTTEQQVYLTGLVKCRPAGADGADRAPTPDEVAACRPFLERELALTGAAMLLTFGQAAAKGLLGVASRGKVHRYGELPVVATYHPADLLRRPEDKAKAWADLCLARATRDHA